MADEMKVSEIVEEIVGPDLAPESKTGLMAAMVFLSIDPDKAARIMQRHAGPQELGIALRILENSGAFDFDQDSTPETDVKLMDLLLELPSVVIDAEVQS